MWRYSSEQGVIWEAPGVVEQKRQTLGNRLNAQVDVGIRETNRTWKPTSKERVPEPNALSCFRCRRGKSQWTPPCCRVRTRVGHQNCQRRRDILVHPRMSDESKRIPNRSNSERMELETNSWVWGPVPGLGLIVFLPVPGEHAHHFLGERMVPRSGQRGSETNRTEMGEGISLQILGPTAIDDHEIEPGEEQERHVHLWSKWLFFRLYIGGWFVHWELLTNFDSVADNIFFCSLRLWGSAFLIYLWIGSVLVGANSPHLRYCVGAGIYLGIIPNFVSI